MTIADLFARIGLKTDEDKAKSFTRAMKGAKAGMITATVAAGAVSAAITKITADAMKSAVALKQFEAETGASAQTLQKWQAVAEQTNQSAESVTSAIKAIAANQEKIKLGQGNISGYQLLGIDPKDDPFDILEQLRTKTDGLSDAMKKNILQQMGVGTGLIQTLDLTKEQFDAMASRAFIISPGAIESLNALKSTVDLTRRAFGYMKAQIAVGLAPQITALNKKIIAFIKNNEEGIIEGFKTALKWVSLFTKAIINTISAIDWLVTGTIGWKNAVFALIGVFALLNAQLLASPIGLITAGIILLIAVLDDLYIYSKGGKSIFGKMMEAFPELEKVLFGFLDKFKEVKELFKAFASGDELMIDNILEQWGIFGDLIQKIKEGIEYITGSEFKEMQKEARDARGGTLSGYERMMGIKPDSGTTNNIEMNVYGSDDPIATGNAAARQLQSQINAASAQRGRTE